MFTKRRYRLENDGGLMPDWAGQLPQAIALIDPGDEIENAQ